MMDFDAEETPLVVVLTDTNENPSKLRLPDCPLLTPLALADAASADSLGSADLLIVSEGVSCDCIECAKSLLPTTCVVAFEGSLASERSRAAANIASSAGLGVVGVAAFGPNAVVVHSSRAPVQVRRMARAFATLLSCPPDRFASAALALAVERRGFWAPLEPYAAVFRPDAAMHDFPDDVHLVAADMSLLSAQSLPGMAFSGCTRLLGVALTPDLRRIGECCFECAVRLRSLAMPVSVEVIEPLAFSASGVQWIEGGAGLKLLSYLSFGAAALSAVDASQCETVIIHPNAFLGCEKLRAVRLPAGCAVARRAFSCCIGLAAVEIAAGAMVDPDAFASSNLQLVHFMGTIGDVARVQAEELRSRAVRMRVAQSGVEITWDGMGATALHRLTSADIAAEELQARGPRVSLRIVGGEVRFDGCEGLRVADLSALPLKEVPTRAFWRCAGLERAILPPTVSVLGAMCFSFCLRLVVIEGLTERVELCTAALEHTLSLRSLPWALLIRLLGCFALLLAGALELQFNPEPESVIDLGASTALQTLRLATLWRGELALISCVGLRELSVGNVRWKGTRACHLQFVRYSGIGYEWLGQEGAAFEYAFALGEVAALAGRCTRPALPL